MSEFDKVAADWDKNKIHLERSEAIARSLLPRLELRKTKKGMEFGAGTGLLSFLLKDKFEEIELLDNSLEMVKIAVSKIEATGETHMKAIFFELDKEEYPDTDFDVVFTQMVLHHVGDVDQIFQKLNLALNPGGTLAIADLYPEDGSFHGHDFNGHCGFDPKELAKLLTIKGFENISIDTCYTIKKEIEPGIIKDFPVFLLIAQKKIDSTASIIFKCNQCNWTGSQDQLEWESVETCMGTDKVEICPKCSSMAVFVQRDK